MGWTPVTGSIGPSVRTLSLRWRFRQAYLASSQLTTEITARLSTIAASHDRESSGSSLVSWHWSRLDCACHVLLDHVAPANQAPEPVYDWDDQRDAEGPWL